MLRIFFGKHPKEIYNTEVYYANQYDKMWVMEPFAKKIIKDIDDSTVIGPDLIENDIFGKFNMFDVYFARINTEVFLKNSKLLYEHESAKNAKLNEQLQRMITDSKAKAKLLNKIVETPGLTGVQMHEKLVEVLGHSPKEVIVGALIGLIVGLVF